MNCRQDLPYTQNINCSEHFKQKSEDKKQKVHTKQTFANKMRTEEIERYLKNNNNK